MIGTLVAVAGLVLGAAGTTVMLSAAMVGRHELTRWISQRLRGAAVASTLFSAPGRILRTASAVSTAGVLIAGFGLAAVLAPIPVTLGVTLLLLIVLPAHSIVTVAVPRVVAYRAPESIVRWASPLGDRLSRWLRWLIPGAEDRSGLEALLTGHGAKAPRRGEMQLATGVLAFTQTPARDAMTPRTEIVALHEGASLDEIGRLFAESGYSRLPVYRESLDHIVGMIYAFDLLKVTPGSELPVRPVLITPGSKECATLLLELQRARLQLAVVLDEFGGTAGIVTLEDLLEELVGEIFEETDADPSRDGPDFAEFDGSTPSYEVATRFGVELPRVAETIGGLLAREAGRIPQTGERLILDGLEFDVLGASPTRVHRVSVRRGPVRAITLHPGEVR